MSFLAGLLGGSGARLREHRQEEARKSEHTAELEQKFFSTLAQSPDPEVATLAISGLLESMTGTRKKKKGLAGFIGEMEGSPIATSLKQLIGTPKKEEVVTGIDTMPSRAVTGAGVPSQPTPAVSAQTGPMQPGQLRTETVERPRQILRTPQMEAEEQSAGRVRGVFTGLGIDPAALTPEQSTSAAMGQLGAPPPSPKALIPKEVLLADGSTAYVMIDPAGGGAVDINTGQPVTNIVGEVSESSRRVSNIVPDPGSPTGFMREELDSAGNVVFRRPTFVAPQPAFSGTFAAAGTQGQETIYTIGRGGEITETPIGRAVSAASPEAMRSRGLLQAVNQAIRVDPILRMGFGTAGQLDQVTQRVTQGAFRTYADLATAAQAPIQQQQMPPGAGAAGGAGGLPSLDVEAIINKVGENRQQQVPR